MDLEIKADKEGLFEIRPTRPVRRKLSGEAYEQESFEDDDWDTEPEEEIFHDIENQVSNEIDSADQILTEDKEKKEGKPEGD
ncbi:hypothetical protein EV11_0482 [Prochlorococcus sp. SS52]|nr:hypothetical protein EV04_1153 [Prochlorococcus marinus str. LG]KGG21418.1 hypothetical protein EV08_0503 [Prochlorococcus marinus str. SS2]KGG23237.1 hypothetical protein EV09_1985 [Prochlorococcus marinus str. SS35]KGG33948.1 hypothetical protein EV10_0387 [Prochlorococcus marinus str. SS51]KGG36702.1 hypothetical protein EV11_0482 [Prochlorococcus sp. SS52]